jgi:hypothetical protein
VRRWTLITLIVLLLMLVAVTVYQIGLARQRADLPHPGATPTGTP